MREAMEKDKVEVKKIVIRIGTVNVELTVEQTRELRTALAQLLGEPLFIPVVQPIYVPYPVPQYSPAYPFWQTTWYDANTCVATVTYTVNP